MTVTSDSSPLPVIETIPLGEHLPTSERVVYKRNPVIDGIIDFSGGTAGLYQHRALVLLLKNFVFSFFYSLHLSLKRI